MFSCSISKQINSPPVVSAVNGAAPNLQATQINNIQKRAQNYTHEPEAVQYCKITAAPLVSCGSHTYDIKCTSISNNTAML